MEVWDDVDGHTCRDQVHEHFLSTLDGAELELYEAFRNVG
jgi:hypothetical protein